LDLALLAAQARLPVLLVDMCTDGLQPPRT